jgi:hypothetical protein
MEPHVFVAEVYRRMSLRHRAQATDFPWSAVKNEPRVLQAEYELAGLLPAR